MNARQDQLFKAIVARCSGLENEQVDFRNNTRARIAECGYQLFKEVVADRGCRASFGSIFGRPATDAERMRLHRDLAVLERAGVVTLSQGEGRQRYVQPVAVEM